MTYSYEQGNLARVTATYTNAVNDSALDPTTVCFSVRSPDGIVTTYEYGVDGEVVKSSAGVYTFSLSLTQGGHYCVRSFSEGVGQAAEEIRIVSRPHQAVE